MMPMSSPSARGEPMVWLVPSGTPTRTPMCMPALDDSELLAALRAGDASAATALHDRVRPQVDRTVCRLLGARDVDRDDVAQQATMEIVSTIHRYRGACALNHRASMITARLISKHIRRRKFERRVFGALDAHLLAGTSRSMRQATLRSTVRRVLAHLNAIDKGKAWAFVLHDVYGYDLREIAKITDVSVAAAQARLVRGRREVHELIADDPELAHALDSTQQEP